MCCKRRLFLHCSISHCLTESSDEQFFGIRVSHEASLDEFLAILFEHVLSLIGSLDFDFLADGAVLLIESLQN